MKKYVIKFISLTLAVVIGCGTYLHMFGALAADESDVQTEYLSDIKIAKASASDDAQKKLTDNGYNVFSQDLMEGAGGDYIYIGYKTTNDKSKAITDINMMNMNGGFKDVKYREIAEKQLPEIDSMVSDLKLVIKECKQNIENKSPAALACYYSLGMFRYKTLSQAKESGIYGGNDFSDKLINKTIYDQDLKDLLLIGNQRIVSYMYGMLALGVADYDKSNEGLVDPESSSDEQTSSNPSNWVERMASYKAEDFEDLSSAETEEYRNASNELIPQIKNFINEYKNAKSRAENEKNKTLPSDDYGFVYLSCFDFLNKYSYEGVGLGDYFLGLADGTYDEKTACYPFAKALTRGQRAIVRAGYLTSLLLGIDNKQDNFEGLKKKTREFTKEIQAEAGDSLSVWYGTDVNLYDKEVALTDEAARASTASARYDYLNPTVDTTNDKIDKIIDIAEATMKCSFGAALIVIAGYSAYLGTGSSILGTLTAINALASTSAAFMVGAICAWTPIIIGIVCIAVIFWCLVTELVIWAKEKYDYYHPTYTSIPETMFSFSDDKYIKYTSINNIDTNEAADINGSEGNTWNALYYTTDTNAGQPIEVKTKTVYSDGEAVTTYLDDVFKSKTGDGVTPKGYKPVASFGENVAANLNFGAFKDKYKGVYLFFKRTDGDNKKDVANDGSKYVTSIKIFSNKSEESARLAAQKEGYTIVNRNLTKNEYEYSVWNFFTKSREPKLGLFSSCSTKLYTYFGYKTTTNAQSKNLVTDIRVTYNYAPKDTAFTYGVATYANAGTFNDISIWYTTRREAGDPIVDDFVISDSSIETPKGYEAVSLFADTNAFDLNYTSEKRTVIHPEPVFLYFKSSVDYGDDEYIGGITFVNTYMWKNMSSNDTYSTNEELGQYFYSDLVGDVRRWGGYSTLYHYTAYNKSVYRDVEGNSYMKFTFTKNPKRAITNIYSYSGLAKNVGAPDNMTIEAKGYAVSKSYYFSNVNGFYANDNMSDTLVVAQSNSYIPLTDQQDGYSIFGCNGIAKALYMCGPTGDTKDALKRDDIEFSDSSAIPNDNFKAVNDITLLNYAQEGANLANTVESDNKNKNVYMFLRVSKGEDKFRLRKVAKDEGKYISSLVSTNPDTKTEKLYRDEYAFSGYDGQQIAKMEKIISALASPNGQLMFYSYSNENDSKTSLTVALRIDRTDDYNKAITDIKLKVYTDNTPVEQTITINNVEYQNCGKVGTVNGKKYGAPGHAMPNTGVSNYTDFSVYIYATKNASIDSAICDYSFDSNFFSAGKSTAYFLDVDNVYNDPEYSTYKNKKYNNFAGDEYPFERFMHFSHEEKYDKYISKIKVFSAETKENTIAQMSQEGYRYFYDCDLNKGFTENVHYYTYIAYKMDDRNAITNIVALPMDISATDDDIPSNIYILHRNTTQSDSDKNAATAGDYSKYYTDSKDVPQNKYYKSIKYNLADGDTLNGKSVYKSELYKSDGNGSTIGKKIVLYYTKSKYAGGKSTTVKGSKTTTTITADPLVSFCKYASDSQEPIYNLLNGEATDTNYSLHQVYPSAEFVYVSINRESNTPIKKVVDASNRNVASAFTTPNLSFIIVIIIVALILAVLIPLIKKKKGQKR